MEYNIDEEKIMNFMAMTEINDRNLAIEILQTADWDEITATNIYMSGNYARKIQNPNNVGERLIDSFDYDQDFYLQQKNNKENDIIQDMSDFFGNLASKIFGSSDGKNFVENFERASDIKLSKLIKFEPETLDKAANTAKTDNKPLFLFVTEFKNDDWLKIQNQLFQDQFIQSILDSKFVCFGVDWTTNHGKDVKQKLEVPMVPYVGIFHVAHDSKLDHWASMVGDEITADELTHSLMISQDMYENFKLKEKLDANKSPTVWSIAKQCMTGKIPMPKPDSSDDIPDPDLESSDEEEKKEYLEPQPNQYTPYSNLSLKEQQRNEYHEAQLMDKYKIEQLIKVSQRPESSKHPDEEEDSKHNSENASDESNSARLKKKQINDNNNPIHTVVSEPDEDNKEAATIQIRLADGSKSITRRFLKSWKIKDIHNYIKSIGEEARFEEENPEFEIVGYNDLEQTLENAKLFPRAKVYLREL